VPTAVAGGYTFAWVGAGRDFSCALTATGQAYCWGDNTRGQLGDGTLTSRTFPAPAAGALRFASLSVGGSHACGVTADGSGYCWGANDPCTLATGQCDNGQHPTPSRVDDRAGVRWRSISAASNGTCAISTAGRVYCWGINLFGELGDGTRVFRGYPLPVRGR
jgi:alpha-tubulin suppressor-like RCC1 family protein